MPPFGVDLDKVDFGATPNSDPAPSGSPAGAPEGAEPKAAATSATKEPSQTIPDLDRLERVRYKGRELSQSELEKFLSGGDKPAENENARFDQNFRFDFDTVLRDPSKLDEFRKIYPADYVKVVETALERAGLTPKAANQEAPWKNDPEYQQAIQFSKDFQKMQSEQRVQRIDAHLDTQFDKLGKKYPEANPNLINFYLQGLHARGEKIADKDGNISPALIEKLFKEEHEKTEAAYEKKYRAKVEAQKNVNSRAKDMGTGGSPASVPGQKYRTIKEATAAALAEIGGSR